MRAKNVLVCELCGALYFDSRNTSNWTYFYCPVCNRVQWDAALYPIMEYFDFSCAYCGHYPFEALDHVVPQIKGAEPGGYLHGGFMWSPSGIIYFPQYTNVVPACKRCNSSKGGRDLLEWYTNKPYFQEHRLDKILLATMYPLFHP